MKVYAVVAPANYQIEEHSFEGNIVIHKQYFTEGEGVHTSPAVYSSKTKAEAYAASMAESFPTVGYVVQEFDLI